MIFAIGTGIEASPRTPADLSERLSDIRRWSAVIERAGIAKQ